MNAGRGLTDIERVAALLKRAKGRIHHRRLDKVSPLAVPVLLEVGREQVYGGAMDRLLYETSESLIAEAMPELTEKTGRQAALPI
jgi:ATP-dependent Lhr-like helicase